MGNSYWKFCRCYEAYFKWHILSTIKHVGPYKAVAQMSKNNTSYVKNEEFNFKVYRD